MKKKKITLWRVTNHEFNRALRVLAADVDKLEMLKLLVAERRKALLAFSKGLLIALIGVLWIENRAIGGQVDFNFWNLQFSVPLPYLQFVLSFFFAMSLLNFFNYMHFNEFIRLCANSLFRFDNGSAISLLFDGSSAWSLPATFQYRFLKSKWPHLTIMWATLIFAVSPILIVLVFVFISLGLGVIDSLSRLETAPFSVVLSIVAILLLLHPVVWIVIQGIPFSFEKHVRFIRWNFLFRLYQRAGHFPAHVNKWLSK